MKKKEVKYTKEQELELRERNSIVKVTEIKNRSHKIYSFALPSVGAMELSGYDNLVKYMERKGLKFKIHDSKSY